MVLAGVGGDLPWKLSIVVFRWDLRGWGLTFLIFFLGGGGAHDANRKEGRLRLDKNVVELPRWLIKKCSD